MIQCMHCGERVRASTRQPVCSACGYFALIVPDFDLSTETASIERQAKVSGKKRRCRSCKCRLPSDRYYQCYKCDPGPLRETAFEYDSFAAYEGWTDSELVTTRPLRMDEEIAISSIYSASQRRAHAER